jgi:hypothetical protein
MSTRLTVKKARLSFPYLFIPRPAAQEGQEAKYQCMLLIDKKDKATIKALREAEAEAREIGKTTKFGGKIPANLATILKDGDEDGTAEDYPERTGMLYMTVSSNQKFKPGVVDKGLQEIIDQSEVYSGVYANVSVTAYPYNTNGNKGVTFGLNNVQILGYGDSLAGGVKAADEFEAIEDDEDEAAESLL